MTGKTVEKAAQVRYAWSREKDRNPSNAANVNANLTASAKIMYHLGASQSPGDPNSRKNI